jgi:phosphoglucosamine mutase
MARELFGTDGIRGVAGQFPLDPATAHAVGIALGRWASRVQPEPEIVLGMDTRESGPWLTSELAGGLVRAGARPRFAGIITTPGVAHLTRTGPFLAGVVISASHNPYQDNGIKVFGHSGYKLPDEQEHALEREIFALLDERIEPVPAPLVEDPGLGRLYLDYLASAFPIDLAGVSVAVDCANGAAFKLAPALFRRLGAHVHALHCSPDGRNINLNCGAVHMASLQAEVTLRGADLGVALDGDGDRAMFVSRRGKALDGDAVLLLAARSQLARGCLPGPDGSPAIVATAMSNLGLEQALHRLGIRMLRAQVGDKYVLEEMLRSGCTLGGEQSGHILFLDYATTGDGLLTALRVLEIMRAEGMGLEELVADLELYPQRLLNVRVAVKKPFDELPEVEAEIQAAREAFGDSGRVFVRYSGTEPLARVMVEGPDQARVEGFAHRIADAIRRTLG